MAQLDIKPELLCNIAAVARQQVLYEEGMLRQLQPRVMNRLVYLGWRSTRRGVNIDLDRPKGGTEYGIRYERWDRNKGYAKIYASQRPRGKRSRPIVDILIKLVEGRTVLYPSSAEPSLIVPIASSVKDQYGNISATARRRIFRALHRKSPGRFYKRKGVRQRIFMRKVRNGLGIFEERESGQTILLAIMPRRAKWKRNTLRWEHHSLKPMQNNFQITVRREMYRLTTGFKRKPTPFSRYIGKRNRIDKRSARTL